MRSLTQTLSANRRALQSAIALALILALPPVMAAPAASAESAKEAKSDSRMGLAARISPSVQNDPESLEMSLQEAMWTALAFEDVRTLKDLLSRGATPNKAETLSKMTPLMAAESAEIVELLLAAGANPNQRDRLGRTALHHAVKAREAGSIVRVLGQAGAKVDVRAEDLGTGTPLLSAVEHYAEEEDPAETAVAIRILVHLGADIEATDSGGRSALAIAAAQDEAKLIELLLELGANPSRSLEDGRTPLDYAREADAEEAMKVLSGVTGSAPRSN